MQSIKTKKEQQYECSKESFFQGFLEEVCQNELLTREEEIALAERIKNGDKEAKDQLVMANMRLVFKVTKDLLIKVGGTNSLDFQDLAQEGVIGLMIAADKFDPQKYETKFSTYAVWWIRQKVLRAINNQDKVIRVPVYMSEILFKVNAIIEDLATQEILNPTPAEIAEYGGLEEKHVKLALKSKDEPLSIDYRVQGEDEGESDFGDFIEADLSVYEDPFAMSHQKETKKNVMNYLNNNLDDRSLEVIQMRYGLGGYERHTLSEVGEALGLTKERIRQLEYSALATLKSSSAEGHHKLKGLLEEY